MSPRVVPPHSIEAEESVIGGVLVHPRVFDTVVTNASPEDFYHPALRAIAEAMVELYRASKPIDAFTVGEQMRAMATLDRLRAFGGVDWFVQLMANVVTVENIAYHAKLVRRYARARRVSEVAREVAGAAHVADFDVDAYLATAQQSLLGLKYSDDERKLRPMAEMARDYVELQQQRLDNKSEYAGHPTGFADFDALTSGLMPGDLWIVAARPSMGKTAFAMNAITNMATSGIAELVFSLEMGYLQLIERMFAAKARIDSQRLRRGRLQAGEQSRFNAAFGELKRLPVHCEDASDISLTLVAAKARQWHAEQRRLQGVEWPRCSLKIDYLQLMLPEELRDQKQVVPQNREREIATISRGLKALAKELRIPVVALSQLNRGLEARADKRPMMSDLRESGAIEQDADGIAFLYRDEVYNPKTDKKGVCEVIIGKHRNGSTGAFELAWRPEFQLFENIAHREEDHGPPSDARWG